MSEHMKEQESAALPEKEWRELLLDLRARHGRIAGLNDEAYGPMVFKSPERATWKRFITEVTVDDPDYLVAHENYLLDTVVHPARAAFQAILDRDPIIASEISTAVQRELKPKAKLTVKK